MKLDNGILTLELTNKGGEMSCLKYKDKDILYKGDGPFWSGKNPGLFPFISSPNAKEYTYQGVTYPCHNHGIIRQSTLLTVTENSNEVTMMLQANDETLKEYPFNFEYKISYHLDNKKVLIDYYITNKDDKVMPFTFGLHPGFNVSDFSKTTLIFPNDQVGEVINQKEHTTKQIKLGNYTKFIDDVTELETVILKNLKSDYVILQMEDYSIKVDMSQFKYLALWTPNKDAKFMCIEPWLSVNDIKPSNNPFKEEFELEYLQPNQTYHIGYFFEILD